MLARGGALVLALALLAACGNGGSETEKPKNEFTGRGPITFATGKDTSGNRQKQIDQWNKEHPKEKVRIIELPESADQQRQQMVKNAQTKSDAYTVLNLDVVWTAEFAANRWVDPLPENKVDTKGFLQPTIDSATYFNQLYGVPLNSDGGLLYYRKDLLDKAGVSEPPETWADMEAACEKVQKLPQGKDVGCYAGQFEKYEGLTVNFSEAVHSAGGEIVDDKGKVNVDTPEAKKGLDFLVNGVKQGTFPKASVTYMEEESRRAFQSGKLVFMRNWPYVYGLASTEGSSKVKNKFDIAPLPGQDGPGVSSLGGHNVAVSSFAKNKATALDFIEYITAEETQREDLLATSQAPTRASLYEDEELTKKYAYLPTLKESIETAKPRPQAVKYGDVSTAMQEAAYGAMNGEKTSDEALSELETELEELVKK
ncbi:MAG: extracellular solute-binding protein [Streptosporangiales bacterium]|nr:extracellular solute-binding protein [Streptosporangiales bacterium]